MTAIHFVVPDSVVDPLEPSGGNLYDRKISSGLASSGWQVREHLAPGGWPRPDAVALSALGAELGALPDNALVLVDGLLASAAPRQMQELGSRACLVVLLHLPLSAHPASSADTAVTCGERRSLLAASAVVTTSIWTRDYVLAEHHLAPHRVHVAIPGTDPSEVARGTSAGTELLCVAAVTALKGQDVLLAALAANHQLHWRCSCVGTVKRDRTFVAELTSQAAAVGLHGRFVLRGTRVGTSLDEAYASADVVVVPSRLETYGMVVTEALARGLPVIASAAGGVPEAMGVTTSAERPGLVVPAGDVEALANALKCWLTDARLRNRLRKAALDRRAGLPRWSHTVEAMARAIDLARA